jgi:biopolymer transport protein ExbB
MKAHLRSGLGASLVVAGSHLALGALAMAQGEGAGGAPAPDFGFLKVWILGGGGVGFIFLLPIEAALIATVFCVIEHFISIQRDKLVPSGTVAELEALLDGGHYEEAVRLCASARNYVTSVVGAALSRFGGGYDGMASAADAAVDEENLKLQQKIGWLPLLGNVGPLMGLFGTVTGMVLAFMQIASSDKSPLPKDLALGIFTALVTTVWGLLVAIPASFFSYLFKRRVQSLTFELTGLSLELVERFKPPAAEGR